MHIIRIHTVCKTDSWHLNLTSVSISYSDPHHILCQYSIGIELHRDTLCQSRYECGIAMGMLRAHIYDSVHIHTCSQFPDSKFNLAIRAEERQCRKGWFNNYSTETWENSSAGTTRQHTGLPLSCPSPLLPLPYYNIQGVAAWCRCRQHWLAATASLGSLGGLLSSPFWRREWKTQAYCCHRSPLIAGEEVLICHY